MDALVVATEAWRLGTDDLLIGYDPGAMVVQGGQYKLRFTAKDYDTGLPYDPSEIVVFVERPSGATEMLTKSNGDVTRLLDAFNVPIVGRYGAVIDTSPEAGDWHLQVSVQTANGLEVVKTRAFTVEPWLSGSLSSTPVDGGSATSVYATTLDGAAA